MALKAFLLILLTLVLVVCKSCFSSMCAVQKNLLRTVLNSALGKVSTEL